MLSKCLHIFLFLGIFFLFLSINSNKCIQQSMTEESPFDYYNFDQNYYKWDMKVINYELFFLLKESRFQDHKFARGNLKKKIDFKRDFHFNLKDESVYVNTLDSSWWRYCLTNYGIAVILGPYEFNDYPEKTGENMLFNGLTNSVVIAFRANHNQIAIYNCKQEKCNINNFAKKRDHSFTNTLRLNMHIVYLASEHKLQIYENYYTANTNKILEYEVNLAEGIENGNGYLGLTATDYHCGLYHHLTNSYICLNGGKPIHPTVTLKYNEEIFGIYDATKNNTIPVIERDKVEIYIEYDKFENKKLMGNGQLYINSELYEGCKVINNNNDNKYIYECFLPEEYGLYNITYQTFYEGFTFIVDVQSSEIDKLVYAYGRRKDESASCSKITENNIRYLKFGSLSENGVCGGDFDLSEFSEYEYLIFYAQGTDKNGKGANIRDLETIKQALKLSCGSDIILEKATDPFIYKVGVKVIKKGTYSITAQILDRSIYFDVRNLVPNSDKSNCKIENSLDKPFKSGERIKYICEFNDNDGLPIQIKEAITLKKVNFETKIVRLKNNLDIELRDENQYYENNIYTFIYETDYNGKYKFETKFGLKNKEDIFSSQIFEVSPEPTTLEGSLIYDFTRKEWIEINNLKETDLFYYDEEKDNNENLFMIDLVDMRDPNKTKYSDIEKPYDNFEPILIKGKIYEYHSEYEGNLSFEKILFENKNYILAKLENKNEMRRSSYNYFVILDFTITKNLTFNYILYYAGSYKVCRRELNFSNSIVKTTKDTLEAGTFEKVGEIILRTDLDHLYNYFLDNQNLIKYPDACREQNTCEVQLTRNTVEGVYDVKFKSNLKGEFNIYFTINNTNLFEGQDYCEVKVVPIPEAFIIDKNKTDENEFICGNDAIFEFTIKDKFGNLIEYDLPPNKFGLTYSIIINGEENSPSLIRLEKKLDSYSYYIVESYTISGNYSLTLKTKNSKIEITYNYYKHPGHPRASSSKLRLLNNNKLNLHDISIAELKLYDENGNYIDPELYPYDTLENIEIFSLNGNKDRIDYYYYALHTFISYQINTTGSYYLYGKINNEDLKCISCNFEVVDYGFDFDKSQFRMIGEKSILMKEGNYYTLYKGLQRPAFEFDFMTQEGLPSNEINKTETNILASIINKGGDLTLKETWIDKNKLIWPLPDDYDLEKYKDYTIEITNNNTIRSYYLSIVEYGQDESSDNEYSLKNTYISPSSLYLTAGKYESFIIEFRGSDNLRFNQDLNINDLDVNGENDLAGIEFLKRNGSKKGQFIIDIKLNKTCEFWENCKILIFYENHEIGDGIQIIVKPDILHHFSVDPSSLSDENLKPGIAGNPSKIYLTPFDQYGNLIKESIFDSKIYQQESLRFLFNLKHQKRYKTTLTTTTNPVSFYVELSLSSEKIGELILSSIYLEKDYKMEIKAGGVSKYSTGYLDDDSNTKAGINRTFIIEPRDINGNRINDSKTINHYSVKVYDVDGNLITEVITPNYNESKGYIQYQIINKIVETKVVKAYYKNEEIILNNNVINVVHGDPVFDKTKLLYNGKEYSLNEPLTISLASLPIIDLQLYDNFDNKVDIAFYEQKEFELKVGDNMLSKYIICNDIIRLYIKDSQIDNYFSIKKTEINNILYIKLGSNEKNISFTFEDEAPQKDTEVPKSLVLDTDNLLLKAGEQGLISMKFYSEKSKIIGNFFDLTDLKVSCPNDKDILYKILYGKNYGYYHLFISSEKPTDGKIICSINYENLEKEFKIRIIPNKTKYCDFTNSTLPNFIAGEEYSLEFKCFDDYENVAYLDENHFSAKITNKYNEIVGYNINLNTDNTLNLYFVPITAGNYTIKSHYLLENITFEILPGKISPENSYLNISKEADAGEDLTIDIYVVDKYNNVIDAIGDHMDLFDLYYRYPESSKYNEYRQVEITPTIKKVDDISVIRYRFILINGGVNEFRGIHKETSTVIKCSNCEINVKPGPFNLNETDIYTFNTFSQSYKKLKKYKDNLYNLNENLLIRIYPKDKYGNNIPAENLPINISIDGKKLEKENSNEEFLEFEENTGKFSNLSNDEYDLDISNGKDTITYKVDVSGENGFSGQVDESNTKLLDNDLEFTAGQYGYFNLELRNDNNIRYNKKFDGEIEIKPSDKENIECFIYNKNSSTILVLVTSKIANIFPNNGKLDLEVLINKKKAFKENLDLLVHPDDLSTAEINSIYLDTNNQLKSVTADDCLRFSLIGKDYLNNSVLINPNEAKLIVKKDNNEISYKSSYFDLHTGEQNYLYDLTLIGLYTITSGDNAKGDNLFKGETYTINVTHGEVCPEKTTTKFIRNPISAGNNVSLIISVKDKNNNDIKLDNNIIKDFSGYILSNDYNLTQLKHNLISSSSFNYEELLEKVGTYQFNVGYKKRKIKCDKLIVNPSQCKPENTLIYSKDKNGEYIEYNGETNVYSSFNSPLSLSLIFRDEFLNTVSDNNIKVENAFLYGNNMNKLDWDYNNRELYLDLKDSKNKNMIEHLVSRYGNESYYFNFTVKYTENKKEFTLKVNHFGKKEDEKEYGNGDYNVYYSYVEPTIATFRAGTSYEVFLTLKTIESLIYNGEFNISNINCDELDPKHSDPSFTCTKSKKDTGIYSLKYYTTLAKNKTVNITNIVVLYSSDNTENNTFNVLLNNTFGIPSKEYTNITKSLKKIINPEKEVAIIEFKLKDKYGNEFNSEDIINNLEFENHGIHLDSTIQYLPNDKVFSATFKPGYPPKDLAIQLYYKDDEIKTELFPEIQTSELEFDLDYSKTIVKSTNVNSMKAGEFLDLSITFYDKNNLCYNRDIESDSFYVNVQGPLQTSTQIRKYSFNRVEDLQSPCKYIYKIDINNENKYNKTGSYSIVVYVNEGKTTVASYSQTVISNKIDVSKFKVYYTNMEEKPYDDQNIPAGETIHFTAQAYDEYDNKIDHESLSEKYFTINITPDIPNNVIKYYNGGSGALNILFNTTKVDEYKFGYKYNNSDIDPDTTKGPRIINIVAGSCSVEYNYTSYPNEDDSDISVPYTYTVYCHDKYNNTVKKGGAKFKSEITLFIKESQSTVDLESKVKDNEDGTYSITFTPPLAGEYAVSTYLDGKKYSENMFNITGKKCNAYKCPNTGRCVDRLFDCIPKEYQCRNESEQDTKPFQCNSTSGCVDSMTKCIPEGAAQCQYMKVLYPEGKGYLCSYYLPIDCKRKYPSYRTLCEDGICRTSKKLQPNQRVCPIGTFLCPDLTCKDNYKNCYTNWPQCGNTQIRCPDQSCADDQNNCPTTITCSNPNDYVCPDGTCVENEIYCAKLKTCPDETPYLCSDNSCATEPENCPHTVACGHGKSLCSDLICRETC